MAQFRYGPPRYSARDQLTTEIAPDRAPSTGAAKTFELVGKAFDSVRAFVRPAAEKEQTDLGTAQALEDVREGRFQMRKPYSVRSRAYNAASERVVGAKARTAYQMGVGDAIRSATSADDLRNRLNGLVDESMRDLPPEFANVRAGLEAQNAAMFEMTKGRFAKPDRMVSREKSAAAGAVSGAREVAASVAQADPTSEAGQEVLRRALDGFAQFGPPEEFLVGGVTYPADPKRPGIMTAREIAAEADELAEAAARGRARAAVAEADVVAPIIADIERNRTGLPPDVRDAMVSEAVNEQNKRNVQRRAEEQTAAAGLARLEGRPIPADVPSPPTLPVGARMQEQEGRRAAELEAELQGFPMSEVRNEIDRRVGMLSPARDAERVRELEAYLDRAVELAQSGAIADDPSQLDNFPVRGDALEQGRKQWGDEVNTFFQRLKERPPTTVEEIEEVERSAREFRAEGRRHARDAGTQDLIERGALERNRRQAEERANMGAVVVARQNGQEVADLNFETPGDLATSLAQRSADMANARDRMGLVTGTDLTASEAAQMAELLQGASGPERVEFMEQIGELPMAQRRLIGGALREIAPGLAAAITAAGFGAIPAARAIDQPSAARSIDQEFVADMAGQDAADVAADLAFVGIDQAEQRAIEIGAAPEVNRALRDRTAPEDLDADVDPATARQLSRRAPQPFDTELTETDKLTMRILEDPQIRRLAEAVGFSPDSPEAVASFSRTVEEFEATAPEERDAYVAATRADRVKRNTTSKPRPLYYSGDEITLDGLKAAAQRIVKERRRGAISQEVYERQGALIQSLVEELNG